MRSDVLLLDDELVTHECPLHADLEVGDLWRLTPDERRWCELACEDIRLAEEHARRMQLAMLEADEWSRWRLKHQLEAALSSARRVREHLRRMIAGESAPPAPAIDLYAR